MSKIVETYHFYLEYLLQVHTNTTMYVTVRISCGYNKNYIGFQKRNKLMIHQNVNNNKHLTLSEH